MIRRLIAVAAIAALPSVAGATAIIKDGNVSLGVDTLGQLNVRGGNSDVTGLTTVGTRWIDGSGVEYESTAHGCLCEGWGLAVDGTAGFANNDVPVSGGSGGLTPVSFVSTATTATSVVKVTGTDVEVTHAFQKSKSDDLYEAIVTIKNTGLTDVASLEYRRTMDWDTSPTPFSEFVTIGGTSTTTLLSGSSNDGFEPSNPLGSLGGTGGTCAAALLNTDATCGPRDHGALFDFDLGGLDAGEEYSFSIFYGGAANKTMADAALGAVGAELFSYGWSGTDTDQDGKNDSTGAATPTFIFAFKGVGGTVIVPPPGGGGGVIPLPAGVWLMLGGLGFFGWAKRRQMA